MLKLVIRNLIFHIEWVQLGQWDVDNERFEEHKFNKVINILILYEFILC